MSIDASAGQADKQAYRDTSLGRSKAGPNPDLAPARPTGRRPYRLAFNGTSGPLNRISPDPPTMLITKFQGDQSAVSDQVKNSIRALWDVHMDPEDFPASWNDLGPIMKILIAQNYVGSAVNAAEFYRNMKVVHGLDYPKVFPAPLSAEHVDNMARSVATGSFYHNLKSNEPGVASNTARNTFSGAASRFALNGARNTITAAVVNDTDATGWERLIEPDACSYCAAQAAKGPFKPGNRGFRAHDYCKCLAIPVLRGTSMPGLNSSLREEWNRITGTFTGKDARNAWDQYWREYHGSQEQPGPAEGPDTG